MNVLVLTDGVAGHDRASEGVVVALARRGGVAAHWLGIAEVRPRSRRLARVSAAMSDPEPWIARNVRLAPDRVAPAFAARAVDGWPERADVIVSTGPSTAAANIAVARRYRARNVYCGFPKWPSTGFTVILSPVPSRVASVALVPRPSDIDAADFPVPRPLGAAGERRVALLFGGESKHHRYAAAEIDALAAALAATLDALPEVRLVLYDSRRTAAALFDRLVAALPAERIIVHRFADGGIGSNRAAFAADLVLVTADSLSMITEALSAGRPTLVIRADAYRGPRRDRQEIAALAGAGLIAEATFGAVDAERLLATPVPSGTSGPAQLAEVLAARGI